jgi:hypothetical protein
VSSVKSTDIHRIFRAVDRGGEIIFVHETAPVWVVHYDAIEDSYSFQREFWHGYHAIAKVKKGAPVWSANNKRIGEDRGFKTLFEALEAAAAVAQEYQKEAA